MVVGARSSQHRVPARTAGLFSILLYVIVCGFTVSLCEAATVEVTVRERTGPPVRDLRVVICPPIAPGESSWEWDPRATAPRTTDAQGKAVFDKLDPGSYTVVLADSADPFVDPSENPYAPAPVFTIVKPDERVPIVVELWRGVPLLAELRVDHDETPPGSLILHGLDGLHEKTLPLRYGRWQGLIVPGRWEARFDFPAGYLLVDLMADGQSVPGASVKMDATDELRARSVTAQLEARSLITGSAVGDDGSCPAQIVATLVAAAGDWSVAAAARGGSELQQVTNQFGDCFYRLWVPEGIWRVRPVGDRILESDPAEAEVVIAAGETRTQNFALRLSDRDRKRSLRVRVVSPEGKPVSEAVVEVYRSSDDGVSAKPVATAKTEASYRPGAWISGLSKGSYRVVAGHPDFLEGEQKIPEFDPEAKKPSEVTVVLEEGARIHGHAVDDKGGAVREVELQVERLGDPPKTRLAATEIRDAKLRRALTTDDTGHAVLKGLYAGDYRVAARLTGELAGARFVRVRRGSETAKDSLVVTLGEGETVDLVLLVLPAASLAGSLACSDHGTLPAEVAFRVFDSASPPDPGQGGELREGSLLASDSVRLSGRALDLFRVGPLEPGAYIVAIRPKGDDYWTWPPRLLMPERTTRFHLEEASSVDAGHLEIECGPVLMLVARIASQEPVPDLRAGTLNVAASVETTPGRRTDLPRDVDSYEDRFFARGLPEGKVRVSVRFRHPYLIPDEVELPATDLSLERGKLLRIELPLRAVGGLLEVQDATAARRISVAGEAVVRRAVEGKVSFPGSPAGIYRVERCGDPECAKIERSWDSVTVVAGRTVSLP